MNILTMGEEGIVMDKRLCHKAFEENTGKRKGKP